MSMTVARLARMMALIAAAGLSAGGMAAGGAAAAAAARAGAGPGWRIVTTVGSASRGELPGSQVVATSASNAFIYWQCSDGSVATRSFNFIDHWNGRRWVHIALPVRLNYPRYLSGIGASSAKDLWAVTSFGGLYVWNGTSWKNRSIPSWVLTADRAGDLVAKLSVFAPDNAWIFSSPTTAAHYDRGAWHKVSLPATADAVTALAPDDIWAEGITSKSLPTQKPVWTAMHWDGSAWHTLAFPHLKLPASDSAGYQITATGPRDLWALRQVYKSGEVLSVTLLHWTGSWHAIKGPSGSADLSDPAPDGSGGLWMSGIHAAGSTVTWSFYHYGRQGWSQRAVPAEHGARNILWSLTSVPGTRSLWASGVLESHGGDSEIGDLMKYGT